MQPSFEENVLFTIVNSPKFLIVNLSRLKAIYLPQRVITSFSTPAILTFQAVISVLQSRRIAKIGEFNTAD